MCVCDLCKKEVPDTYDGRVHHISQRHPAHIAAQLFAEMLPSIGNVVANTFADVIRPRRRKQRRNRRGR